MFFSFEESAGETERISVRERGTARYCLSGRLQLTSGKRAPQLSLWNSLRVGKKLAKRTPFIHAIIILLRIRS